MTSRRRALPLLGLACALTPLSCAPQGFAFVSIHPTWAYPDGCRTVTLSGHGFGDSVTATIGGAEVESVAAPERELDQGFLVTGVVPANSSGVAGPVAVTLKTGGDSATLEDAFYFLDCPSAGYVETVDLSTGLLGGETITLDGCGLDASALQVQITQDTEAGSAVAATAPLTSTCRTTTAAFIAPTLPAGSYHLTIADMSGNQVFPAPCDTADTGLSCLGVELTYGGAQ
jgi:hypothetical protein